MSADETSNGAQRHSPLTEWRCDEDAAAGRKGCVECHGSKLLDVRRGQELLESACVKMRVADIEVLQVEAAAARQSAGGPTVGAQSASQESPIMRDVKDGAVANRDQSTQVSLSAEICQECPTEATPREHAESPSSDGHIKRAAIVS